MSSDDQRMYRDAARIATTEIGMDYDERHGIESAAILTVMNDEIADLIANYLEPRITGKTIVEIGGGLGILSLHLGLRAKRVFCIEANPMWASGFAAILYANKPKNVSYLFGAADEFVSLIKGEVSLFCSHSGIASMRALAGAFAPEVIDVYGEIIEKAPMGFDPLARMLRGQARG